MAIDLNSDDYMGSREASLLWGKQKDYVRTVYSKYPERFPRGSIRKFGHQLVVTKHGMEELTGMGRLERVALKKDIGKWLAGDRANVIGIKQDQLIIKFNDGSIIEAYPTDLKRIMLNLEA